MAISSYYIPGLVESTQAGNFVDMLRRLEQVTPLTFDLSLMPTKRVQESFKHQQIVSYFPELEEFRPKNSCRSIAFMHKQIIAFTRVGEPPILSIPQLRNKRVGAVKGYSYGLAIKNDKRINLIRVKDDMANLKKLLLGRVDVVLGDIFSTVNAINALAIEDKVTYSMTEPIAVLDVFFVFRNDHQGLLWCDAVSDGLKQLKRAGDFSDWLYQPQLATPIN